MSELHCIGLHQQQTEVTDPQFVTEGLLAARDKSWNAFREIKLQLKEGMTEEEGRNLANRVLSDLGSSKHWHRPYIRFGPGTALTFYDPLQANYRLQEGDPIYMDLGPVWRDDHSELEYEGDVGDTFSFGSNSEAEQIAKSARELWIKVRNKWFESETTGEDLYLHLRTWANELGYMLVEKVSGHRLSDYPHTQYSKERLNTVAFNPRSSLWVLELQINHPSWRFGAFYEDLLL